MVVKGFTWHGDDIVRKVEKAARMGINRTMGVCVTEAKSSHPFENRTGNAERSIRIVSPAQTNGDTTSGLWGSVACIYFKWLEFGTALRDSFPTLRPAARRVYPILIEMIKKAYREVR